MAGSGAKRYARAIFELAKEDGQVDQWTRRLEVVQEVLTTPEAMRVLANPAIAAQRRQEAAAALVEPFVEPAGVNLARLLVGANRLRDMPGIMEEFQHLADEDAGRVRATATTAVPLAPADAEQLQASLSRRLGRDVRLDARVDGAILGGLVLRIGDRVIDASVATRLQQLRRRLAGV